jgi:hypothetical protein
LPKIKIYKVTPIAQISVILPLYSPPVERERGREREGEKRGRRRRRKKTQNEC